MIAMVSARNVNGKRVFPGGGKELTRRIACRDAWDVRHRLSVQGPLDLDLTLTCGQAFRWRRAPGGWSGVIGASEIRVAIEGGALVVTEELGDRLAPAAIARYFRLDEDPRIHLEHAPALLAIPGFESLLGLRILRQDSWETLASFVCSAAANIRKITACVEAMAERWGEAIEGSDRRSFPGPERIARLRERDLRAAGLGFRAPYLLAASRRIASGSPPWSWENLRGMPLDQARASLDRVEGVGPKIADCVLLFGLDRLEAYPVDRWIRRATLELASRRRARDEELLRWAARLGPGRGYLQQILFHLRRTSGPLPPLPRAQAPEKRSARAKTRPASGASTLLVFAKAPVPGKVKTRLVPPLSHAEAAEVARACLETTLTRFARAGARRTLLLDGVPDRELRALCRSEGVTIERQSRGDLGARLRAAFRGRRGSVLAIGSDSPTLDPARIEEAASTLAAHDVVLGPAEDGGYYLIGVRRAAATERLFRDIPWSTRDVARVTLERARSLGLAVHLLPAWYDVDDPESLRRAIEDARGTEPALARSLAPLLEKLTPKTA